MRGCLRRGTKPVSAAVASKASIATPLCFVSRLASSAPCGQRGKVLLPGVPAPCCRLLRERSRPGGVQLAMDSGVTLGLRLGVILKARSVGLLIPLQPGSGCHIVRIKRWMGLGGAG